MFLNQLQKGQKAVIKHFDIQHIPLKLIELGCLPDSRVELMQIAPLGCPMYFNINESYVAIRTETAKQIEIEILL
ncbi:MAG: FeoA family protein [Flavobacteriaceae bacterium]